MPGNGARNNVSIDRVNRRQVEFRDRFGHGLEDLLFRKPDPMMIGAVTLRDFLRDRALIEFFEIETDRISLKFVCELLRGERRHD